jgi:hypothetical protein
MTNSKGSTDGKILPWIVAITAIAAIFRLAHIETAISWDEAVIYFWVSREKFTWLLSYYANVGNHVFLTILTAWSYYLFGNSLLALRIPAILAGIALVPATFLLAEVLANRRTALLAAGIAAGLNFLILYSVNERGYGLQATLVVLLLLAWTHYWESGMLKGYLWASIIALTLALYTLPTTLFIVPALVVVALVTKPKMGTCPFKDKVRGIILFLGAAGALTFLCYLPILLNEGLGGTVNNRYLKARMTFGESFTELVRLAQQLWQQSFWGLPSGMTQIVAILITLGLIRSIARKPALAAFVVVSAATVVAALLAFNPAPVRAFVFYVPLCVVALSYGIDLLLPTRGILGRATTSGYLPCAVAVMLGSVSLLSEEMLREASRNYGRERGSDQLVTALAPMLQPGDQIERIIPQHKYWMERLGYDAAKFPEFNESRFVAENGRRVFVVVRHLRESLERVLQTNPFGQLKTISLADFSAPTIVGRYGDFDLYLYTRHSPTSAELTGGAQS